MAEKEAQQGDRKPAGEVEDDESLAARTGADEGKGDSRLAESHADTGAEGDDAQHGDDQLSEEQLTARREARRAKKARQREARQREQQELAAARREIADLKARVGNVETRGVQSEIALLKQKQTEVDNVISHLREKKREAQTAGNWDDVDKIDDQLYKARRGSEMLTAYVKRAESIGSDGQGTGSARPAATATRPDAAVQSAANAWMSKRSWYNPEGGDEDSDILFGIEARLSQSGMDPRNQEYWDELDKRAAKYLPHRYRNDSAGDDDDEGQDEDTGGDSTHDRQPAVRSTPAANGRPRHGGSGGGGNGSGRPAGAAGGKGSFYLSPGRKSAMVESGLSEGSAEWKKQVDAYRRYDADPARKRGAA